MATITVTLTSYNMGSNATREDYDSWTNYVEAYIDDRAGFLVCVEYERFGAAGDDRVSGGTDEQHDIVREALRTLWDEWCALE